MAMAKPFKHPRTGVYWFRRGVPADVRRHVGKREWKATLKTKSLTEAENLILPHLRETNRIIADVRAGLFRRYSDEQIYGYADAWGRWMVREVAIAADWQHDPDRSEKPMPVIPGPATDESDLKLAITEFLDNQAIDMEPDGPDYSEFVQACLIEHAYHYPDIRLLTDGEKAAMERHRRFIRGVRAEVSRVVPPAANGTQSADTGPGLLEVFERYLIEAEPTEKTAGEFRKSLNDFCSLHDGDLPIRSITKAQVVEFKDLLLQKPKGLTRKQARMDLRDLVQAFEGKNCERISLGSVRKGLVPLNTVMNYAVRNAYLDFNSASGVAPQKSKAKNGSQRLPYSVADMNAIFASPVWSGCASKKQRGKPGNVVVKDSKFWIPLLALWTGARIEEMAQLRSSDVCEQDGIAYLDITDTNDDQTLKTEGSKRRVPIHSELIRLGFLDYARSQNGQLFPELKPYRGKLSFHLSKWWGRYARDVVGIGDSRKVFHSFRHAWKDAARESGLDMKIADALQGHADGSVSSGYGSGYTLKRLAEDMDKIEYPGLNLEHLEP